MSLENKIVVITGAGSGIGRALAIGFASDGASVIGFGRDEANLVETAKLARSGRMRYVAGSVTSESDVDRLVGEALGISGRIDVLINNAAIYPKAMLSDCLPTDWLKTIEINVLGPLICFQKILPGMLERGQGRIINVGSFAGRAPLPGSSAYSVSKAALNSLTRAMAAEIDRTRYPNVLVNELIPGAIRTRMSEQGDDVTSVYPYAVALVNLPPGGPTGRIFLKGEIFHEDFGIKSRLKRKLNKILGKKSY